MKSNSRKEKYKKIRGDSLRKNLKKRKKNKILKK
tara:strand:+ start:2996 stop:3097 length:102 start_codon:yes stop_codon:yes gene_type:complete